MASYEQMDYARAWIATAIGAIVLLTIGAIAFPQRVYEGFLWRYFWGPVVADGNAAACAIREDGTTHLEYTTAACTAADGIVVFPGYTTVSTISYGIVLVFMLIGVLLLIDRWNITFSPTLFYALFPYMLLGGALRTVEDLNATFLRADVVEPITFPANALIISPFIYFVMFVITLAVLLFAVVLARRGYIQKYEFLVGGVGVIFLGSVVGWLLYMSATSELVGFYPIVSAITLIGSTIIAGLYWWASTRYFPQINAGTGFMGAIVVWGHSVDGVANVLSLDWATNLGLPVTYGSKHVINEAIVTYTAILQPAWVTDMIGSAWPFLPVKVAVAIIVVYIFDDEIFEESPRYAYLLLIAILAVGLGPGTRDMLRATLGI